MKRRILSIITALALCLSLCPTWALAAEADPSLCKHHRSHTEDCGYTAPTEGHDCGHEHTEDCYITDEAGGEVLDCQHSHNSECGYVQADPGQPCGYECRICPIEDLIAALPEQVTEDNAAIVRGQLDHILDLYRELTEDEQEEINLSRVIDLQGALDAANAPMAVAGEININSTRTNILTAEAGGCPGHTFTGTTAMEARIYVESGVHNVTFSSLNITSAKVGIAPGATMNLTIEGANTIKSSEAGIYVPVGATLVINGNGSLNVSGGVGGAGIGGATYAPDETGSDGDPNCGTVEINGGTVTATGGRMAAGIGGGEDTNGNPGNGGNVTINGGTVTAAGGVDGSGNYGGAGIGGSAGVSDSDPAGNGGTLTINGGTVNLTAGNSTSYGFGQGTGSAPGGTCELTLADESYLTLTEGTTLDPNGKYTINGDPTADMIVVPEDLIYNGKAQELDGKIYIDDSKTGTDTYFNQTFTVKASAEGWELQDLGEVVEAGEYTATFKKGDKEISKTFTVAQSGTQFVEDGVVKTFNGIEETDSFTAGDTITVKATPTPTGEAPVKAVSRLRGGGKMAVFVGDTRVSAEVDATEDGSYTMTVNAADVLLAANGPKTGITLTAKFVGNTSMADGQGTATVNITAAAKVERDGTVIGYYGESNLADAFDDSGNDGATFTLLANVEPNTCLTIQINCILNLGGHTITGYIDSTQCVCVDENTAVTILGEGEIISPNGIALAVDGNATLEGGTYTSTGSEDFSHGVYVGPSATLSVTGEKVSIRNTSGGNGLVVVQAQSVQLSAGTYEGGTAAIAVDYGGKTLADVLAHTDTTRYAYFNGDTPIALEADSKELTGTVTVKACTHAYQYTHTTGAITHSQTCPACGDAKSTVPCSYNPATGRCACGSTLAVTLSGADGLVFNGKEQTPAVTVTVDGTTTLTKDTDYTVAYENNVSAGENTAKVTVTGTTFTGTTTLNFSIAKAALTVDGTGTASGEYGKSLSQLTVNGLTAKRGETEVLGIWKLTGDTVPNVGDSGEYTATFTPTTLTSDTGADNYKPLTAQVKLSISKATAPAPQTGTLEVQNKVAKTYTYNLEQLLPDLGEGKTLGDVTYTLGTVNFTAAGYYDSTTPASISGTTLTLPIKAVDTTNLADIGTVTVTITSQNYADMTATITVKSVNKTAVDITGVSLAGRAYNGSPVEYQQTAAASVNGSPVSVKGFVYTWNTPDGTAPVNAGSYTLTVSVDPEDPSYTGSINISVTIEQAEITITAPSRTIYVGGTAPTFSASDCAVTGLVSGESLKTPPTVAYEETPDTSKTGSVTVKASGAAVPEGGNYKERIVYVDGTLTVKEPSSSGGGGGGGDTPVNVTGVSLDRNSLTLTIGESFSLTVTITPSNADNKSVTWASGNSDVASVNGGTVTATGVGTTTITVTTQSGGYTASCTVTVKAKAYTITYDANGGAGTMRTGSAADGEPFTLPGCTFTPPEGKVFDAWAIGSADGTQTKAGSSHTFTEDTTVYAVWKDAPLVTYAVTYNANGGTGTMTNGIAPDQEAFVLPECGFTAPEGKEFDCWAIGSATGPKVQPGGGYIFTANTTVYALWKDLPPVPYDITGIVWQNGKVVPGATVQLKQGADVIAAQTTGPDGSFTFSGVPAGVYNLVAIKDGITVTVMQEITNSSANLSITLPNGNMNTEVEVKPETPPVIVGGLENIFQDETVYTPEDKEVVDAGGTVEFKLVVEKQDASSSAAIQIEASKPAGQTIGLFLDLSIIKTVTPKDGQAETTSVTQVGSLIETLIPLPDEMQGKASYTVYREHDGIVEALPNSGNGERYTVSSNKKSITIYARKYSTYAVAWSDNGGDTPVDPGKPSRPSGGGGSSVSTYAVTVSKMTYGKVVSSRTNASSGSTVTLTVIPDSGYTLDTLTLTDSRGNAVKLTDKGNGKYTFTMPSRAVTVTASFAPIVWNNPYTDVATGTWYYEAVRFVSENGLMGGYGKGLFGPNDNLSRAQLVQILYNHAGRPVIQNGSAFTDAAPGAWYADAVAWAAAEGIISGYGGGRFGPNDPITREQLAVMLWRYAGFPIPPNLLLDFPDANTASGYALDALRWAVDQGIISGYSNGRLEPKTPATRGQVAQILQNFFQKR